MNESDDTIDDVDLDSSLYENGDKKGVDIQMKRNSLKQKQEQWRKGGFAPIKKLKLTTEEPAVAIPPFFPEASWTSNYQILHSVATSAFFINNQKYQ